MSSKTKKIMPKEVKEVMMTMQHQIENSKKELKLIKEPNGNPGVVNYNNRYGKKITRGGSIVDLNWQEKKELTNLRIDRDYAI